MTDFSPALQPLRAASWRSALAGETWKFAALTLFAAWVFVIGSFHEPWFDEAQAWVLARDSGLAELLTHRVRYEGSPGLWHAILWLAIRTGWSFDHLYLLSGACAVAGAAIVLWRAPFPPWIRLGTVFSYYFAFQYAVVARSYALDLVLVPLVAALFPSRCGKPLRYGLTIGLLANCNAHSFLAAGLLGMELAWQLHRAGSWRSLRGASALAMAAGLGVFALACAWQPPDNTYLTPPPNWGTLPRYLLDAFVDRVFVFGRAAPSTAEALVALALLPILLSSSVGLIAARPHRLLCLGILAALILFSVLVYSGSWHAGLLFLFWVFAVWISWPEERSAVNSSMVVCFAVIVGVQALQALGSGAWELAHRYGPGREAAGYIEDYRRDHPGATMAAVGIKTFNVQPWLDGNPFFNVNRGRSRPAYVDWTRGSRSISFAAEQDWARALPSRPAVIMVSLSDFPGSERNLTAMACRQGYVQARRFDGTLLWRGYEQIPMPLVAFEKARVGSCATR